MDYILKIKKLKVIFRHFPIPGIIFLSNHTKMTN